VGPKTASGPASPGLVREDSLVEAISKVTRTEKVDLSKRAPEPGALAKLEASYCQDHGLYLTRDELRAQLAKGSRGTA